MIVVIPHHKSLEEAKAIVDKASGDLLALSGSIQVVDQKKEWAGETMSFSGVLKYGFVAVPIAAKLTVDDANVTISTELPKFVSQFIGEEKLQASVSKKLGPLLA